MTWDISQGRLIDTILVDAATLVAADPWETLDALSAWVVLAHDRGGLRADELAPELLWNSQLTSYLTQALRNGHYLYVGNTQWQPENVAACRAAMVALGAPDLVALYDDLAALVAGSGIAMDEWNARYGEVREDGARYAPFAALDDRLFAMDQDALSQRRAEWVRSLPKVEAVAGDDFDARADALFAANPLRTGRLHAVAETREVQEEAERRERNQRLADVEASGHARNTLARLRRAATDDPDEVAPVAQLLPGEAIVWPVTGRSAGLMLLSPATGKAMLLRDDQVVSGPTRMDRRAAAFFARMLASAR